MPHKKRYRIGTFMILSDPYWVQAEEAIVHTNHRLGDQLVMLHPVATNQAMRLIPPQELIDQILASSLDALITTVPDSAVIAALLSENLPVVCLAEIDIRHPKLTVSPRLYPGGVMAGEFIGWKLGGKGHAVCVSAGREVMPIAGQSRLAGFQDALKAFDGITTGTIHANWDYATAYPVLIEAFQKYPQKIDAIFGVSDTLALAAREAARELGVIDDHTILVGLNGDPLALAAIEAGQLSATIDTASEALGAEAVRAAHLGAAGEKMPEMLAQTYQLIDLSNVAEIATRKLIAIADIPSHMVGYNRQQELDRISQLEKSMEISRRVASLMERNRLVEDIGQLVGVHYGYEWMRIFRWSEANQVLELYEGNLSPAAKKIPIELDELLFKVFHEREPIFIADIASSRRWRLGSEWAGVRSRAVLPITVGDAAIGILDLQSSRPVVQVTLETVGLELLATQIGIALQNADLFQNALQARQTAEKANQLKARLVANVGHEMRTPLNAILGFSQSIEKELEAGELPDVERLRHDIQRIYKSGEHLMYMINDLLDLSRAEIGALNLYFEPVELKPLLFEVFQAFYKPLDPAHPVEWVFDIPERLPVIRADIVRFRQIMMNLLSNAAKFTKQGTIRLGANLEPPFVHIWVADTGSGVSLELQNKIFEPFGSLVQKGRREGIGLGLSITRHLVTLHEGLITLDSAPGAGSIFHVYLPLPGVENSPLPMTADVNRQAILVLSEREQIPTEIRDMSEQQNIPVYPISRRVDLVKLLAEVQPTAIAWDYACVDPEEWLLINRIRSNPKLATLPVIFYNSERSQPGTSSGLTHLVFKPSSVNTLGQWLDQVTPDLTSNPVVLIVDDDPEARSYYRGLLIEKNPKAEIYEAENGRLALEFLDQGYLPGMILLDLIMPDVDGFTVLQKIRSEPQTRHIPVVIMSGKLLDYQDVQRLDYQKTMLSPKGVLNNVELIQFMQGVLGDHDHLPQPTSRLVKLGLAYIHMNYNRDISRKDIADALGISVNYLTDIFRQEMAISPFDYLSRVRIQKARELLEKTDLTVTAVALRTGFTDAAYFSRVFRKTAGITPIEYRRTISKNR